jgi:hypothetical protein
MTTTIAQDLAQAMKDWDSASQEQRDAMNDAAAKAALAATTVDIAWISEYGLDQKLSNSIRCF